MSLNLRAEVYNLATAQTLTNAYAKIGTDRIDARHYTKIGVFVNSDVNDSTGIIVKAFAAQTLTGDLYEVDGLSSINLGATDEKKYYEFASGAIPFIELQVIATVVGATAGKVTVDITKIAD
jgi:hypothetical protein